MKQTLRIWLLLVVLGALSSQAQAVWNADWPKRVKIGINTSTDGVAVTEATQAVPVLLRLHSGNFPFLDARADGADLRLVAGDDTTPLKFHIEKFDGVNELALIWVQLPVLNPNSKNEHIWVYYGNANAAPGSDPKGTYDNSQLLVWHFGDKQATPQDASAAGHHASAFTAKASVASLIGGGAIFDGAGDARADARPSLKTGTGGATVSMWIKPAELADAVLFSLGNGLSLRIRGGRLAGQAGSLSTASPQPLSAGAWQHVALVLNDGIALFVNGLEVARVTGTTAGHEGAVVVGRGFKGELDELQFANVPRSADWLKVAASSQGEQQKLLSYGPAEGGAEGQSASYMKILLGAVTIDGWVVIAILALMFVISVWVMISKAAFVARASSQNEKFKKQFERLVDALRSDVSGEDTVKAERAALSKLRHSQLGRLYGAAVHELRGRFEAYAQAGRGRLLSEQSLAAIRATVDARLVRETQRLNAQMVLLTISIAGGPFLGLLGTVVGVMITFAAIAAAGDVNVNSIAPGIAAALVATVAGLAVAIPALFGYNYLTGRIQAITSDMQVFVDEIVTRFAENHSE